MVDRTPAIALPQPCHELSSSCFPSAFWNFHVIPPLIPARRWLCSLSTDSQLLSLPPCAAGCRGAAQFWVTCVPGRAAVGSPACSPRLQGSLLHIPSEWGFLFFSFYCGVFWSGAGADAHLAQVWGCVKAITFALRCSVSFPVPGEGAFLTAKLQWQCSTACCCWEQG